MLVQQCLRSKRFLDIPQSRKLLFTLLIKRNRAKSSKLRLTIDENRVWALVQLTSSGANNLLFAPFRIAAATRYGT